MGMKYLKLYCVNNTNGDPTINTIPTNWGTPITVQWYLNDNPTLDEADTGLCGLYTPPSSVQDNGAIPFRDYHFSGGILTHRAYPGISAYIALCTGLPINYMPDNWAIEPSGEALNFKLEREDGDFLYWYTAHPYSSSMYYNGSWVSKDYTVRAYNVLVPFMATMDQRGYSELLRGQFFTGQNGYSYWFTNFINSQFYQSNIFFEVSRGIGAQNNVIISFIEGAADAASDPNDQGGTSEAGGGGGNFDDESDPIPLPPLPTVSATDCGLITAFVPSRANLIALGNYLYSSLLDLDTLKRIFDQPMEHIIGLNILPFTPTTSSTKEITFANFSTGVTNVPYISQQYQEIDCGSIEVKEYWGSALDYSPNTRCYLWLPHIGFVQIDVDIIMGKTCHVVYRVDTVTGTCMAVLIVNNSVINHWTGELALNIPLSSADYSRVIGAILGIAGTAIGVGAAVGGAMKAGEALGAATNIAEGMSAMKAPAKVAAANALTSATNSYNASVGSAAVTIAKGAVNTVSDVMGAKLGIQMSGAISGQAGIMDVQKPYFMFIRPNQSLAENYKHYVGYPSNMYASVESCSGFTIFEQIELSNITATDPEIAEIASLLKGGFYG